MAESQATEPLEFGGGIPAGVPHAFVQWKGTNVCMDFYCECGAHCHFDGYFAYVVQCPHCLTKWEMPFNLFARRLIAGSDADKWHGDSAKLMMPDEDFEEQKP